MQNSDESVSFQSRVAVLLKTHSAQLITCTSLAPTEGGAYPKIITFVRVRCTPTVFQPTEVGQWHIKTAMSIYDPSPERKLQGAQFDHCVNKVELMRDGVNVMISCVTLGSKRAVRSYICVQC